MYSNAEAVFHYQFEQLTDAMATTPYDIDGIAVYNPITPGFPGFMPGDDLFYEDNAFSRIDINAITAAALEKAYASYNGRT